MFKLVGDLLRKIEENISAKSVYVMGENYSFSCRGCDGECGSGCSGAYCSQGCDSDCSSSVYDH